MSTILWFHKYCIHLQWIAWHKYVTRCMKILHTGAFLEILINNLRSQIYALAQSSALQYMQITFRLTAKKAETKRSYSKHRGNYKNGCNRQTQCKELQIAPLYLPGDPLRNAWVYQSANIICKKVNKLVYSIFRDNSRLIKKKYWNKLE